MQDFIRRDQSFSDVNWLGMLFELSESQVLSLSDKYIYKSENGTWKLLKAMN